MMKYWKIFFLLIAFMLIGGVSPSFAQNITATQISLAPQEATEAIPICRKYIEVKVVPGKPLRLHGTGRLTANGKGEVYYSVDKGRVTLEGKGAVAVKASNNDKVEASGWSRKFKLGEWTVYMGKGTINVNGDNYEVVGFGKFDTRAWGRGSVTFRGNWKVSYCMLLIATPVPIPDVFPQSVKGEVQKEME